MASNSNGMDCIADFTQGDDLIDLSALGYESMADVAIETVNGVTTVAGVSDEFKIQLEEELALQASDFVWA